MNIIKNISRIIERAKIKKQAEALYILLRANGMFDENNLPYQIYIDRGLFEIKVHSDGRKEAMIRPKGQMYIWLIAAMINGVVTSPLEELAAAKEAGVDIEGLEDLFRN